MERRRHVSVLRTLFDPSTLFFDLREYSKAIFGRYSGVTIVNRDGFFFFLLVVRVNFSAHTFSTERVIFRNQRVDPRPMMHEEK